MRVSECPVRPAPARRQAFPHPLRAARALDRAVVRGASEPRAAAGWLPAFPFSVWTSFELLIYLMDNILLLLIFLSEKRVLSGVRG